MLKTISVEQRLFLSRVCMYNGHVPEGKYEGKLCITDMYLKVNNFIPDMKVKVSHV